MKKNMKHPQQSVCFQERPLVVAVRHALPYLVGLSLALSMVQTASSRSSDSAAAFTATQLVRQFTLKNTVSQVSMGMQGYVSEINGEQRGPAMGARPTGFPSDMGSVPATVNLPRRDGAGRPLGYCAWDNSAAVATADYNAGQGISNPLVYAVVSPGLNGTMQTTCANVLASGAGVGDDHVQVVAPMQVSSVQYKSSVGTFADLPLGVEGDVRLVRDTNKLYSYVNGAWAPVQAGPFEADASGGAGAISYTTGKVTVADFQAATATITGALSGSSATFTGAVTANTFTGNGSGLTDLNADNFSSGVLGPQFGGTGVNAAAAANGTLLIGNGSGFTLGTLTGGAGISVLSDAGAITLVNSGVISITGTADQVIASASNGDIVLSLPQAIAPTSTPTFAGMMLNGGLTGTTATFTGAVTMASLAAQRLDVGTSAGGVTNPNMIVGNGAMPGAQSGTGANTALGIGTLVANTTGYSNTAVGLNSMVSNTTGYSNSAVGHGSMLLNTTGYDNSAVGHRSLRNNTTGFNNIGVGSFAGDTNASGSNNVFLGHSADATTGALTYAAAIGAGSRVSTSNTVVLGRTGESTVIGATGTATSGILQNKKLQVTGNVGISGSLEMGGTLTAAGFNGNGSGLTDLNANNFTTGTLAVARGGTGLDGSAAPNGSLLIGNGTGYTLNTLTGTANQVNVANGSGSITLSLPQSIATTSTPTFAGMMLNGGLTGTTANFSGAVTVGSLGAQRLDVSTSAGGLATPNMIVGTGAMLGTQSGFGGNTALGINALRSNTTGYANTATGSGALISNTTGIKNTATGWGALEQNTSGSDNTVTGNEAAYVNTTGYRNTAMGARALFSNSTGYDNVAVGNNALRGNTTGFENVALGRESGFANTTGSSNTFLGYSADATTGALTYATAIGALATVATSNTLALGRNSTADQVVIGTNTRSNTYANTKLYVNGVTNLNGDLRGTTATFSGAVNALSFAGDGSALTNLNASNFTTGNVPVARGGTGLDGSAAPNGSLLIGNGTGYSLNTLTGTANQVNVTNGSGSITLSLPQSIATTSTPTFAGMMLNGGLTGTTATFSGAVNALSFAGDGSGLNNLNANNFTTGTLVVARGGTGLDGSAAPNGSLLIGNGTGYSLTTLTGTANQVNVSNGAGTITLSLPQSIATTSTPTFGGMTLNGNLTGTTATFGGAVTVDSLSALRLNVGTSAGVLNPNLIIGNGAMVGVQSGDGVNTAVGTDALQSNTTGHRNAAIGYKALMSNTTGHRNVASGHVALPFNTTGYENTASGSHSLFSNTEGYFNTGTGYRALFLNTTGVGNTASGHYALYNTTIGNDNVAIGKSAGLTNTIGSNNTFLGSSANVTTGELTYATAIGSGSTVATSSTIALGRIFATDQVVMGTDTRNDTFANTRLYVNGVTNLNGDLRGTTATFSGNTSVGGTLAVTGTTTLNGAVAVNNSAITFNNVLGDKLNLWSGFGFGINGDNLTAYVPSAAQRLSLRTGGTSTGPEVFTVTGGGLITSTGGISTTTGTFSSNTTVGGNLAVTGTTTLNGAVAVNNSAITFNNVLGDKLNLFTSYGFGINGSNLTAYIPGALQRFSLRTGGTSTGPEVFTVTGGGLITSTGGISTTTGAFSGAVTANSFAGDGSALTNLNANNITTGTLPVARGGTGLSTVASNGQLLIGNGTGYTLGTLTGTANQVNVANGAGSITLSLPQNIATTSTPTFGGMTLNGGLTGTTGNFSGAVVGSSLQSSTFQAISSQGAYLQWNRDNGSGRTFVVNQKGLGGGGISFGESTTGNAYTENMALSSTGNLTVVGSVTANSFSGNGSALTNLNASNFTTGTVPVARGGTGLSATPTNGQLLIGNGTGYTLGTLTGTANQVNVTNGAGSITLSLPQNIATTSTPTFGGMTLNGEVNFNNVVGDKLNLFTSYGFGINGNNLTAYIPGALQRFSLRTGGTYTGTEVFTVTGGGLITSTGGISTTTGTFSGAVTASSFSGNGSALTNLNANNFTAGTLPVARGGTGLSTVATNGQLLIGNGTGYTLGTLTGTANQVNVTNGAGTITLSLPQAIATTSTPTFGGMTLNGEVNFNNVVGDKLNLFTSYGFGVNGNNLTAYIPSATQRFSLRTGGTYTGTEVFTVTGGGLITSTGGISTTTGTFSGDTTVGGTLDVTGATTLTGALSGTTATFSGNVVLNTAGYSNNTSLRDLRVHTSDNPIATFDHLQIKTTGLATTINVGGAENGLIFRVGNTNSGNVGDQTYNTVLTLNANQSAVFTGAVTANSFAGNGAALTNLNANNFTAGTLPVARGGTGLSTAATNGQLLIGNGTGYTLGTLTAGTGIGIANGAGSITLSNTGVTSLAGTVNQVNVSAATGAITLSLPQNIATTSTPTFGGMTVSGNVALNTSGGSTSTSLRDLRLYSANAGATWDHLQVVHDGGSAIFNAGGAESGMSFRVGNGGSGDVGGQTYNTVLTLAPNQSATFAGAVNVNGATTLNGGATVNNSAITFNNILGDKLNLFTGYGFGINNSNLTAYVPNATTRFSVRTGGASTGTEVFSVTGGGETAVEGLLSANAGIKIRSGSGPHVLLRFGAEFENNDDVYMRRINVGDNNSRLRIILGNNDVGFGAPNGDEFQMGLDDAGTFLARFRVAGNGAVISSGSMTATAFTVSSDRRLKKNITAQDDTSVLERLEQLQTYSYEYIANPDLGRRIGVIAQEVQTLFPEAAITSAENGMMSVDYNALGAMAAMGVGQLSSKFKVLDGKVNLQGEKLLELDGKVAQHNTRIGSLEGWKTEAVTRMDGMQGAIDLNIQKIAENAVAIQTNTKAIERLDDALFTLDGTVKGNTESIANINARWARNFTAAEDGSAITVNAVELKVSNFTAQQVRTNSVYTQRLEAEIAKIAELEVNNLRANTAVANTVQAEQLNTGSVQVYAGVGLPAILFAAKADGHYTVSTSSLDGSYATATVIVNAGQAKVVSGASEGIELVAEGNMVKAIAAGKSIKASWIKMG